MRPTTALRLLTTFILCCGISHLQAQMPSLQWVVEGENNTPAFFNPVVMAIDSDGNTLVAFNMNEPNTFAGVQLPFVNLTGEPAFGNTLVKFNPQGELLWHRSLRGPWQEAVMCGGLHTDADNNIYVSYRGESWTENASTIGGLYAQSPRLRDHFIVKIDPEGQGIWFKVANYAPGGWSTGPPRSVVAPDGVYMAGHLGTSVNFDGLSLSNTSTFNAYIVKHDLGGNVLWGKTISNTLGSASIQEVITDAEGNLYATGIWSGSTVHLDDLSLENDLAFTGNSNRWICKIAPDGTALWLAREHSAGHPPQVKLALGADSELLVFSNKQGNPPVDLHIGSFVLSDNGMVLSRYSSDGEVQAASIIGSNALASVAGDGLGAVYMAGSFMGSVLDMGGMQVSNAGGITGTSDAFLAKLNAEGAADWILAAGGSETERFGLLGIAAPGSVVLTGTFNGPQLDLFGTALHNSNTVLPASHHFLAAFDVALNTSAAHTMQQLLAYPNPFAEHVQFDAEVLEYFPKAQLSIYDMRGAEVYRGQMQGLERIALAHLPKGSYIARISDGSKSLHTKIVKQ